MANKPHAGHLIYALARHFNWFQNKMMPEWWIDGGYADLLFISRSGYATEIEVKISLSDWNADKDKDKWRRERPHVARFFYAVPEHLADRIPDWIPVDAGILSIRVKATGYANVRTIREAKRKKALKIPESELLSMNERSYYRFWNSEIKRRGKRLAELGHA